MITYKPNHAGTLVYLDGHLVGIIKKVIRKTESGYQYFPKGLRKGGKIFQTVNEVKATIEAE